MDPHWKIPHYEKMLYSQVLLAILYLDAARILGEPASRQVTFDTLGFVLREMKGRNGGFVASFSAVDGRGVEGGYYLWKDEELRRLLSESDYALARRYWKWEQTGEGLLPLRGESPAQLAKAEGVSTARMQARIKALRGKLLDHRARRTLPAPTARIYRWGFRRTAQKGGGNTAGGAQAGAG